MLKYFADCYRGVMLASCMFLTFNLTFLSGGFQRLLKPSFMADGVRWYVQFGEPSSSTREGCLANIFMAGFIMTMHTVLVGLYRWRERRRRSA